MSTRSPWLTEFDKQRIRCCCPLLSSWRGLLRLQASPFKPLLSSRRDLSRHFQVFCSNTLYFTAYLINLVLLSKINQKKLYKDVWVTVLLFRSLFLTIFNWQQSSIVVLPEVQYDNRSSNLFFPLLFRSFNDSMCGCWSLNHYFCLSPILSLKKTKGGGRKETICRWESSTSVSIYNSTSSWDLLFLFWVFHFKQNCRLCWRRN